MPPRPLALIFLVLLACGRGAETQPSQPTPERAATPAPSAPARAEKPRPSAPAPTREVFGIGLGEAGDAEITAWLGARGLSCPASPAPRRTTVRYACADALPATALPERVIKGKLDQISLTRSDAGPLHDLSFRALYSVPADAAADYNARVAELSALLGPPERSSVAPAEPDPTKPMLWYSSTWRFADLDVSVSLLRAGGPSYGLNERWQLPGVEASAAERPGSSPIHGAGAPKSTNPHAITNP